MRRERNLNIEEANVAALNQQVRGLSPKKRALLKQQLTSLRRDLRAEAGSRDKRLVAYVVAHKDSSLTSTDLRGFLKERLPDHMVPAAVLVVDEMPLTPSGKIDRKRLPTVPWLKNTGRDPGQDDVRARTPVEEIVMMLFQDVLKLDRVGIHDDFFEIGGHSLLATQVVSRVRNAFGVEIGVRSIFEEATVEGLARGIEEELRAVDKEEHLQYWEEHLGGRLPVIDLAGDHPRPQVPGLSASDKSISLPAELCESIRALSRREGVTPSMVLLTAFNLLLYRYTSESDIVLGASMAYRDRADAEPTAGLFADMMPLRTDLSGNPRLIHLLKQVRDAVLGAYIHKGPPFEKWVVENLPERKPGLAPLYNVVFGMRSGAETAAGLTDPEPATSDLMLWVIEEAETMRALWIYRPDLFEEATIARMHGHFETLLSNVVTRPNAPLDELEMVSEAERARQAASRSIRDERNYSKFKSVKPRAIVLKED